MRYAPLDTALPPADADPREYARLLARVHEAVVQGDKPRSRPRPVIAQSWYRMLNIGLDPDRGSMSAMLAAEEVEHQRRACGLGEVIDTLREGLVSAVSDTAWQIMVVTGPEGHVLWRDGSKAVLKRAEQLGFVEGAPWTESTVGTNAIGTALLTRAPVQVYAAEHFVRTHHAWTCAAAPVRSPSSGKVLGVIDVSGPAPTVHPTTLALVSAVARLAESELRTTHRAELERLRAVGAPLLARITGRAVVTDQLGWVAAVSGTAPLDRILLPRRIQQGRTWLPSLGSCVLEPLPGGWLVRATDDSEQPTRVLLDVRRPRSCSLTVMGASGTWAYPLSPRHAELLLVLAEHPMGRTAAQLAEDLFGDRERTVTVRAEVSRLRRQLAGVLQHRPYRFADGIQVEVHRPSAPGPVLPPGPRKEGVRVTVRPDAAAARAKTVASRTAAPPGSLLK